MFTLLGGFCLFAGLLVAAIDPYFHYHAPLVGRFRYALNNQRSQNYGIVHQFDYDTLVTGSSMTENFKTSEIDALFGVKSIKVSFSGASLRELRDIVLEAAAANPKLKTAFVGIDQDQLLAPADRMRTDIGSYPTYLYDGNPLTDVKYLLNKSVMARVLDCVRGYREPGVTSFDEYDAWGLKKHWEYGAKRVIEHAAVSGLPAAKRFTYCPLAAPRNTLETLDENLEPLTHIPATVIFFLTPGSIVQRFRRFDGNVMLASERAFLERFTGRANVRIFSFNTETNIVANLDNYKDVQHYGPWINSLMLEKIRNGENEITAENFESYLQDEIRTYEEFDIGTLPNDV